MPFQASLHYGFDRIITESYLFSCKIRLTLSKQNTFRSHQELLFKHKTRIHFSQSLVSPQQTGEVGFLLVWFGLLFFHLLSYGSGKYLVVLVSVTVHKCLVFLFFLFFHSAFSYFCL